MSFVVNKYSTKHIQNNILSHLPSLDVSARLKQFCLFILLFCPRIILYQRKAIVDSAKQERLEINIWLVLSTALKCPRKYEGDTFTLLLTQFTFLFTFLFPITLACLAPNGAVPHTHTGALIANPCKGQLLLCAEPAVTRRVSAPRADGCSNYDKSLGTFIYMLLNFTFGSIKSQNQIFMLFIGAARIHLASALVSHRRRMMLKVYLN